MQKNISKTAVILANSKAVKGLKGVLTAFLAFITLFGVCGFALFIFEESFQCCQFAIWSALDTKQWPIVMEGVEIMDKINHSSKTVNNTIGWINPLSFYSYRAYQEASDFYIKSLNARIFANDPSLFIGREVSFKFTPSQTEHLSDGSYRLTNRRLSVISKTAPSVGGAIEVTGVLEQKDGKMVVDMVK